MVREAEHEARGRKELRDADDQLSERLLGVRDQPLVVRPRRSERVEENEDEELHAVDHQAADVEVHDEEERLQPVARHVPLGDRRRVRRLAARRWA